MFFAVGWVPCCEPGGGMDVVALQTPVALTFHDGERLVGADALTIQARKPEYTFVVSASGEERACARAASRQNRFSTALQRSAANPCVCVVLCHSICSRVRRRRPWTVTSRVLRLARADRVVLCVCDLATPRVCRCAELPSPTGTERQQRAGTGVP